MLSILGLTASWGLAHMQDFGVRYERKGVELPGKVSEKEGRCSRRSLPLSLLSAPHLLLRRSFPLSLGQEFIVFGIRLVAAASHLSLINFTFTVHQVLLALRSLV